MKNCPFCFESVQIDALKCKHCGEWLNKENKFRKVANLINDRIESYKSEKDRKRTEHLYHPNNDSPLVVNHVQLYPDRIIIGKDSILFEDILSITYEAVNSTNNLSTTNYLVFYIVLLSTPEKLYNLASEKNDFNAIIQSQHNKKNFEVYSLIHNIISNQTLRSRIINQIKLIEDNKYFEYNGYLFYANGSVTKSRKKDKIICNLFEAKAKDQIEWGVAWKGLKSRSYNPNEFRISNGNIPIKFLFGLIETGIHLKVSVNTNSDVFKFIMKFFLENERFPNMHELAS